MNQNTHTITNIRIDRAKQGGWNLEYTLITLSDYEETEVKEHVYSFQSVEERLKKLRIQLNLY